MTREQNAAFLILCASAAALAAALVAQYFFDLQPCTLCLYQRMPYVATAFLAMLAMVRRLPARFMTSLLGLCAVIYAVNAGIAFFHVGVEQHWWQGLASCSGGKGGAHSVEDLKALLAGPIKIASCDQIAWSLFGISMAGYNVPASIGLALFAGWAANRSRDAIL
jgi:disulfide bond formation protein DsbB